jgi:hypothetical protein
VTPAATDAEVRAAFRSAMKRWHPDRHGGAPWAVAKARRLLAAATQLREGSHGGTEGASSASGRRRWWQGAPVLFYPEIKDYWADWGAVPPTAEEAALFQARCEDAAAQAALRRAANADAAAAAAAGGAAAAERAQSYAMLAVAAAAAWLMMHSGGAMQNAGAMRGAPAGGDCAQRGGGWCRFL